MCEQTDQIVVLYAHNRSRSITKEVVYSTNAKYRSGPESERHLIMPKLLHTYFMVSTCLIFESPRVD